MAEASKRDIGESIYTTTVEFIDERTGEYRFLLDFWLEQRNFASLAYILVNRDAENCCVAGAIALRKKGRLDLAIDHWKTAERCLNALEEALKARDALPADAKFDSMHGADQIPARCFYYLLLCLLFSNNTAGLSRLRRIFDSPFVAINASNPKEPDSYAAETRLLYAAQEGDVQMMESFVLHLERWYKRYKISDVHTRLWRAVANRREDALNDLLPEAINAHSKAVRRRNFDMWGGGGKDFNQSMFDTYTTSVLLVARSVGMHWSYSEEGTAALWPIDVLRRDS